MIRVFSTLVILALFAGAAYFVLGKENFSEYKFPAFVGSKLEEAGISLSRLSGNSATNTVFAPLIGAKNNLVEAVARKSEELISGIVEETKKTTFNLFKQEVNEKVNNIGENFGINFQTFSSESPSPVIFAIKTGQSAYFTIRNTDKIAVDFEADWEDGGKDKGKLNPGGSKILSHQWQKAGNYNPKFKIIKLGKEEEYSVSISIF